MSQLRIAYLVSRHPALSHAFVERELAALRARGIAVRTYSLNRPTSDDLRGEANRVAAQSTVVLKDLRGWRTWMRAHTGLFGHAPMVCLRTLLDGLRVGRPGPRGRLWQVFYWAEAVVLVHLLRRAGLRHVHVHFANSGADVARRAVAIAQRAYPAEGPWSWSMSMHGPTEFDDPVGYDLSAKLADASFVACISEWCRRAVLELAPSARTTLVHMGVDLARFPAPRRDRPAGPLRVLFVGRLVPEKGPADLVAALDDVADAELVIAGAGPLRTPLEQRASGRVRFLGGVAQEDLPAWYGWADVFCLPSHAEGLPVALMEALATGLPVVTTPVAGIPELVADGVTGLLVAPGDVAAIAAALTRLRDPALRVRLGTAGRAAVEADFDAELTVAPLVATFDRLPACRPRVGQPSRVASE